MLSSMKSVVVIGAGFGGISAAAYLAKAGFHVTVVEKNAWVGGRARLLEREGFRFDMGPSWYWMPDQHDRWFAEFGFDRASLYQARRVDPSYKVFFGDSEPGEQRNVVTVPANFEEACRIFATYEKDGDLKLRRFVERARRKYDFAIDHFVYSNYRSIFDMVNSTMIKNIPQLNLLRSYRGMINSSFSHPYLRKILEFPVVFLGSFARKTPAVYTLMNYIDFGLGTWYPEGGFTAVVKAMQHVAEQTGVEFRFSTPVTGFEFEAGKVRAVRVESEHGQEEIKADIVVANADYHHVDQELLPPEYRSFTPQFWEKRTLAPAVLNYYIGVRRKLPELAHHTFFFDTDWDEHFDTVYGNQRWPRDPLFYLHIPSATDPSCAPPGQEAVFALVPVAAGLQEDPTTRDHYFDIILDRIEKLSGVSLREDILFTQTMSHADFAADYNSYKGNAFGLGQTLFQTAYFRPANRSRKLSNLYYSGQYTVPGTGTTMSMISGKVAADRVIADTLGS